MNSFIDKFRNNSMVCWQSIFNLGFPVFAFILRWKIFFNFFTIRDVGMNAKIYIFIQERAIKIVILISFTNISMRKKLVLKDKESPVLNMKYALVQFSEGKKVKKYLVETRLIKDFNPASTLDFIPHKQYRIKWQKSFCGDDGYAHDGYYPGEILILGATEEEVKYKAKEKGIRLPSTFPTIVELPAAPSMKKPLRKARKTKNSDEVKEFQAKKKRMEKTLASLEVMTNNQELSEHSDYSNAAVSLPSKPVLPSKKRTNETTLRSLKEVADGQELSGRSDDSAAAVSSPSEQPPATKNRTMDKKFLEVVTEPPPATKNRKTDKKFKSLEVETDNRGLFKHYDNSATVVSSPPASAPVVSIGNAVSPSAARTLFMNGSQHTRMLMSSLRLQSTEHGKKSLDAKCENTGPLKQTATVVRHRPSLTRNSSNLVGDITASSKMEQKPLKIEHKEFPGGKREKGNLTSEEEKECESGLPLENREPNVVRLPSVNSSVSSPPKHPTNSVSDWSTSFEMWQKSLEIDKKEFTGEKMVKVNLSSEEENQSESEHLEKRKRASPVMAKETPFSDINADKGHKYEGTISSQSQVTSTSLDTGDADITEQLDALKKVHHKCYFKIQAAEREKDKANAVVVKLKSELEESRMKESKLKFELEKSQMLVQKLQREVQELKELNINIQRSMLHGFPSGRVIDSDQTNKDAGDSAFVCKKMKTGKNFTCETFDVERNAKPNRDALTGKEKRKSMIKFGTGEDSQYGDSAGNEDVALQPAVSVSKEVSQEEHEHHESDEENIVSRVHSDLVNDKLMRGSKGKVYLGSGISINENLWVNKLRKCQQDSIFVKDIAQGIWGADGLKVRTAEKPAPNKSVASPSKVKVINAMLKAKLKARNASPTEQEMILKKAKTWLGQKMYEAHRAEQKKDLKH